MAVHGNFEDCSESEEDVDDGDEGFLSWVAGFCNLMSCHDVD